MSADGKKLEATKKEFLMVCQIEGKSKSTLYNYDNTYDMYLEVANLRLGRGG